MEGLNDVTLNPTLLNNSIPNCSYMSSFAHLDVTDIYIIRLHLNPVDRKNVLSIMVMVWLTMWEYG